MKIYKYSDYDQYVKKQTEANKKKIGWVYVKPKSIAKISNHFKKNCPNGKADAIICHGTRNGAEQEMFKSHFPSAKIIGTEISETATKFPMTVQHDFMESNDDWIGKFDIVYSNSFDHSIKPKSTLQVWKDQLTPFGIMYIEYSVSQSESTEYDPLDATNEEVIKMIEDTGFMVTTTAGKKRGHTIFMCIQS